MTYRIRKTASVQKSVRRIAAEQIDKAIGVVSEARSLGERLFAEKPSRLRARYRCYWRAWKVSNHEPPELSGRGAADSS